MFPLFRVSWHDNIWSCGWGTVTIIESSLFSKVYRSSQIGLADVMLSIRSAIISVKPNNRLDYRSLRLKGWFERSEVRVELTVWPIADDRLGDRFVNVRSPIRRPFPECQVIHQETACLFWLLPRNDHLVDLMWHFRRAFAQSQIGSSLTPSSADTKYPPGCLPNLVSPFRNNRHLPLFFFAFSLKKSSSLRKLEDEKMTQRFDSVQWTWNERRWPFGRYEMTVWMIGDDRLGHDLTGVGLEPSWPFERSKMVV
jgi:hypothetical protein